MTYLQIDNMRLVYDNVTRTTSNPAGVDIRLPGWGDPYVVEYLDPSKASPGSYFKDVANMLVSDLGYIRNLSIRGAPYDFRKAPSMRDFFDFRLSDIFSASVPQRWTLSVWCFATSVFGNKYYKISKTLQINYRRILTIFIS